MRLAEERQQVLTSCVPASSSSSLSSARRVAVLFAVHCLPQFCLNSAARLPYFYHFVIIDDVILLSNKSLSKFSFALSYTPFSSPNAR